MAKPRNYHALNAIQRKAGFHSGKRKPDMEERDIIAEYYIESEDFVKNEHVYSSREKALTKFKLPKGWNVVETKIVSKKFCPERGEQWVNGMCVQCDECSGEFKL